MQLKQPPFVPEGFCDTYAAGDIEVAGTDFFRIETAYCFTALFADKFRIVGVVGVV